MTFGGGGVETNTFLEALNAVLQKNRWMSGGGLPDFPSFLLPLITTCAISDRKLSIVKRRLSKNSGCYIAISYSIGTCRAGLHTENGA